MLCELRISTDFCLLASHTYCDYFSGNVEEAREESVRERKRGRRGRKEGGKERAREGHVCTRAHLSKNGITKMHVSLRLSNGRDVKGKEEISQFGKHI